MASYSGNWNGAPTSTNSGREGGGFASPYMRDGVFRGKFEGPNTSLAVKYGKYDGVPSGFRSASPFMQGGMFKGAFEGNRRDYNMAQRAGMALSRGAGGEGIGGGGGGGPQPAAGPLGRMPQPPVGPRPVSGLMGRPVFGPPAAPPLSRSMIPALFGGFQRDSLTPAQGSIPSIGPFTGGLDLAGRAVQGPMGYSQQRTGAYANSMYGNPQYGTPGLGGNLANYGGGTNWGIKTGLGY